MLKLAVCALILAVSNSTPFLTHGSKPLKGVPRGGGLFGGKGKTGSPHANPTAQSPTTYPAMSESEVSAVLDEVPVYAVTDKDGQGVVLKSPQSGDSVFYFYMSGEMANATMGELKKSQPKMDLTMTKYKLGQVYFKVLNNGTSTAPVKSPSGGESAPSQVDYRLVPDTRDLMGARMLLTMNSEDTDELAAKGEMTPEIAQKAVRRAMTESKKFNATYGEIPVFMIQQMRISKGEGKTPILPMYFSLTDMVGIWQAFASQDPQAKSTEPAIHLMSLDELVSNMMKPGEVDFRSVMLMPRTGADPRQPREPPKTKQTIGATLGDV